MSDHAPLASEARPCPVCLCRDISIGFPEPGACIMACGHCMRHCDEETLVVVRIQGALRNRLRLAAIAFWNKLPRPVKETA